MENKEDVAEEVKSKGWYHWELTGEGGAYPDGDGEPNRDTHGYKITIFTSDDKAEVEIGKIDFKVVKQGRAVSQGISLYDLYDSEDADHFDYYEHIAPLDGADESDDADELLVADKVIILVQSDLEAFKPEHRFDVLLILEKLFEDVVLVVNCDNGNSEVANQLATVFNVIPPLETDELDEVWFYHGSQYRWTVKPHELKAG
jgi:hypothetical protein